MMTGKRYARMVLLALTLLISLGLIFTVRADAAAVHDSFSVTSGGDIYQYEVTKTALAGEPGTVSLVAFIDEGEPTSIPEVPGSVSVPGEEGDYDVTAIGGSVFKDNTVITSVTLSERLSSIGDYAFEGCTQLADIIIPDSVLTIGKHAFNQCSGLEIVNLGTGLTTIGEGAFQLCEKLSAAVIPDSVTLLGSYAFNKCYCLAEVQIGSGITSINSTVFQRCESLTSVIIPDGVTEIGSWAFYGCSSLNDLTMPDSVRSIGKLAFYQCEALPDLTLPASLTTLGESAFRKCTGLTAVTFPASLTTIGKYAFQDCTGISEIALPDSLTTVGESAFRNCTGLTEITFPASLKKINNYAFCGCVSLSVLELPDGLTDVGGRAFDDCTGLLGTTLVLPESLAHAYNQSFGNRLFVEIINRSDTVFDHYSFLKPDEESLFFYVNEKGEKCESLGKGTYILAETELTVADDPHIYTLTYNGEEQTGVAEGTGYTLSGTFSATNAGSYEAAASLQTGYIWQDGTRDPKTILWTIGKATEKVPIPTGKTFTYNGKTRRGVSSGTGYKLSGQTRAADAGIYSVRATLKKDTNIIYTWEDGNTIARIINWKINKAANPLKVKVPSKTYRREKLTIDKSFRIGVSKAQGDVTYTPDKKAKKAKITVSDDGKVTVPAKCKTGTYTIKVKAAGNGNYKTGSKTVKVVVK